MSPYRIVVDSESVHLVVAPSSYRSRFYRHALAAAGQIGIVGGVATLVALVLTAAAVGTDRLPYGTPGANAFLFFEGLFAVPWALCIALAVPFRALEPGPHECLMPKALTFRTDGILVVPRDGAAFETEYRWIPRARVEGRTIELSLAHDHPVSIHLSYRGLGPEAFERIAGWLGTAQQ